MSELTYVRPSVWYYPSNAAVTVVNTVFGIIGFLLIVRFVLVFLGANAGAPFVAWMYSVTGSLVAPFAGAFPDLAFGGFVIELSTVFAMIGYAIIGWLVGRLLSLIFSALNSTIV